MNFDVRIKALFFDTKAVTSKLPAAEKKALSAFGAFVRKRARSSIRPAPKMDVATGTILKGRRKKGAIVEDATSRPGSPPFAHGPKSFIKQIFFGYDSSARSVVIGPILAGPASGAPEALEEGGIAKIKGKATAITARPFMRPAFATELGLVGGNFRNILRG